MGNSHLKTSNVVVECQLQKIWYEPFASTNHFEIWLNNAPCLCTICWPKAKWKTKNLISDEISEQSTNENDFFLLSKIVTGYETQVFDYNPATKLLSPE